MAKKKIEVDEDMLKEIMAGDIRNRLSQCRRRQPLNLKSVKRIPSITARCS